MFRIARLPTRSFPTVKKRHFVSLVLPRDSGRFEIGQNSHPRKVSRWLSRGGGSPIVRTADEVAMDHIHPRRLRQRVAA